MLLSSEQLHRPNKKNHVRHNSKKSPTGPTPKPEYLIALAIFDRIISPRPHHFRGFQFPARKPSKLPDPSCAVVW